MLLQNKHENEMKAVFAAKKVIGECGTNDVFAIAEQAKIKIIYESWHPVTFGEFDKRQNTICVNLKVVENGKLSEREIIAHELGHFFAKDFGFDKTTEESFACDFAKELIKFNERNENSKLPN